MKNVLQVLIAHRTSWRLRGGKFQHSFGHGLNGSSLSRSSVLPDRPYLGDRGEAEAAMMAAQGNPESCTDAINLFHVRDALMVSGVMGEESKHDCMCIDIINYTYTCSPTLGGALL